MILSLDGGFDHTTVLSIKESWIHGVGRVGVKLTAEPTDGGTVFHLRVQRS